MYEASDDQRVGIDAGEWEGERDRKKVLEQISGVGGTVQECDRYVTVVQWEFQFSNKVGCDEVDSAVAPAGPCRWN